MKKILFILLSMSLATTAVADTRIPLTQFPQSTMQIATPDARLHRFNIWIAQDDMHREQGLMFVKELPENSGMLFVYQTPREITMWMKNTLIPLDMVFIRADGRVADIAANTKPLSLEVIAAHEKVVAVLELSGGTAARLNIRKGAVAMHPLFSNTK